MGSGHFPDDVFGHKSYFNFVTYQNAWSRKDYGPDKLLTKTKMREMGLDVLFNLEDHEENVMINSYYLCTSAEKNWFHDIVYF